MESKSAGLLLVGIGVVAVVIGVLVYAGGLSWFGKLPGDIRFQGKHTQVFVPLTSMLLLSVGLSLVLHWVRRFW